ncbi:MAG: hypothetical protein IJ929_04985, partial [Prevotella sp.]|nr:hypothetical protein [Prevotella sp.]
RENMDADHQKSAFASKRGVPKCPFGELYVLHFQTDDFFKTKSCGKQDMHRGRLELLQKALIFPDDVNRFLDILC